METDQSTYKYDMEQLEKAHTYACNKSTCAKVCVGSQIINRDNIAVSYGCNHGVGRNCLRKGCHRVELYGENSKDHRLPSDCVSIHSEVDAICRAARRGISVYGATLYITRYPCEACARAIVTAGIARVVYGRDESISPMTEKIFSSAGVRVDHLDWHAEDNNS